MKSVHLVIPDLFLPKDIAAEACRGLSLPALQKMLGRGHSETLEAVPLENLLCVSFGLSCLPDAPIAPISAAYDGLAEGCWLRADPVNLALQRDRLLLTGVQVGSEEAAALCASLNAHFSGQGMEFHAPHPQRWYVRLDALPRIRTTPLSQVVGGDVRRVLPAGEDAARWHQVFNEIQMLLHAHPLNDAREARGEPTINSVWFWGCGCDTLPAKPADCGNSREAAAAVTEEHDAARYGGGCDTLPAKPADCGNSREAAAAVTEEHDAARYSGGCGKSLLPQKYHDSVSSDDVLAEMFANAAGVPFSSWAGQWRAEDCNGRQLLVWTGLRSALRRGDLDSWRTALQDFENGYAQPLWQALRSGKIERLQLDIPGGDDIRRVRLTRGDTWVFWRRSGRLAGYSLV
jgi:hypothetical protein